jgi:hypothetical protein
MSDDSGHAKIKAAFADYVTDLGVDLPSDIEPSGVIKQAGWDIRYVFGRDGDRGCLEVYAIHRMTNDRHLRIYDDGTITTLETVSEGVTYNPDIRGDRERAERDRKASDDRLIADLKKKGLW